MALKARINKIEVDITKLNIFLIAPQKFGKTTLCRDVTMELFDGDASKTLLLQVGSEIGAKNLDNLQIADIESYQDLEEIAQFVKDNDIRLVFFDTVDEMPPFCEQAIIDQWNESEKKQARKENARYEPITSILRAHGGYGRGQKQSLRYMLDLFGAINKAGAGVWAIGHTNVTDTADKTSLEGLKRREISASIENPYRNKLFDTFDLNIIGYFEDDEYDDVVKTGFKGQSEKVRINKTDQKRYLCFRGSPVMKAGSRLKDGAIQEKMEMLPNISNAPEFIHIIEEALRLSRTENAAELQAKIAAEMGISVEELQARQSEKDMLRKDRRQNAGPTIKAAPKPEPKPEPVPEPVKEVQPVKKPEPEVAEDEFDEMPFGEDEILIDDSKERAEFAKKVAELYKACEDDETKKLVRQARKDYKILKEAPMSIIQKCMDILQ